MFICEISRNNDDQNVMMHEQPYERINYSLQITVNTDIKYNGYKGMTFTHSITVLQIVFLYFSGQRVNW